jgi:hypothetical protein
MTRTGFVSWKALFLDGSMDTDPDYLSGSRKDKKGKVEKIHDLQNLMFSPGAWNSYMKV